MAKLWMICSFVVGSVLLAACTSAKLYRESNFDKYEKGRLSITALDSVKKFLSIPEHSATDTIIIKYDFNHESCWNATDNESNDQIMARVKSHEEWVRWAGLRRPRVAIFQYREAGNAVNKVKRLNNSIRIDSAGLLRTLLFRERTVCGSSCILLPSGEYLVVKSDAHFEALQMNAEVLDLMFH